MQNPAFTSPDNKLQHLRFKVGVVVWTLRSLAGAYALWVLYQILRPLYQTDTFLQRLGSYWQRELMAAAPWQIQSAAALNGLVWVLLLLAIACVWKASAHLLDAQDVGTQASGWLRKGAWAGLGCLGLGILSRPLISQLYTLHLPAELQLWRWDFYPSDLLNAVLCFALLLLGYLMAWTADIAEENKGFV
jgi:hypothetical protein